MLKPAELSTMPTHDRNSYTLEFQKVVRRYHVDRGLGPVTFTIRPGMVCSVIGPNGSGKTTLIRTAALFELPESGDVYLCGETRPTADAEVDRIRGRLIGTVFQHAELWPHLSLRDNIMLPLREALCHSKSSAREVADQELQSFGLLDRALAMPNQLSGGLKQRAVLARCLALRPKLLLLDEITSALDPDWTEVVKQRLLSFARDGGSVVSVSHRLNWVRRMSDWIIYLENGLIVEQGPPAEVIDSPTQPGLQRFIENA